MNIGYFSPESEAGFRWIQCTEYEIPEYVKMGIEVYATYKTAFFHTNTGVKWERNIISRFHMKNVTGNYSHKALKSLFSKMSKDHDNLVFFAKVFDSDNSTGNLELIGFISGHGVYSTNRKRGKYLGWNIYIIDAGTGMYHKLLYVSREQGNVMLSLAKQKATEYIETCRRNHNG